MNGLSSADTAKLRKIVGLFDSDNAGEAAAAFNAAYGIASRSGLRLTDGLKHLFAHAIQPSAPRRHSPAPATPWERQVMACRDAPQIFTAWERDFLAGINGRPCLSPAQRDTLNRLHSKALNYWASGGAS